MKPAAAAILLLAALQPARAEWAIEIRDAWIRHMAGDRPMAGYFIMDNKGAGNRRLVGASSVAFGAVHIHETTQSNDSAGMRPVESITVPAGGRVEFRPGDRHLMLMQRRKDLEVGDRVPVTLEFADGGSKSLVFTVKPVWQE